MKTIEQLRNMEEYELIDEILRLQKQLNDNVVDEFKSSAVYNYHFVSKELLKLNKDRYMSSAIVMSLHDIKGKALISPVSIKDGFSNETINSLLDDLQYSYDQLIEFKPETKRL